MQSRNALLSDMNSISCYSTSSIIAKGNQIFEVTDLADTSLNASLNEDFIDQALT